MMTNLRTNLRQFVYCRWDIDQVMTKIAQEEDSMGGIYVSCGCSNVDDPDDDMQFHAFFASDPRVYLYVKEDALVLIAEAEDVLVLIDPGYELWLSPGYPWETEPTEWDLYDETRLPSLKGFFPLKGELKL